MREERGEQKKLIKCINNNISLHKNLFSSLFAFLSHSLRLRVKNLLITRHFSLKT